MGVPGAGVVAEGVVVFRRLGAEKGDGTAHGEIAEEAGGCAAGDFDAVDIVGKEAGPVDPAAEGVVHGDGIEQDKGAAGARRSHPAERNALGGGVGGDAGIAPEQREAGHLAEAVVEVDAGDDFKIGRGDVGDVGGGFGGDTVVDCDGGADSFRFRIGWRCLGEGGKRAQYQSNRGQESLAGVR